MATFAVLVLGFYNVSKDFGHLFEKHEMVIKCVLMVDGHADTDLAPQNDVESVARVAIFTYFSVIGKGLQIEALVEVVHILFLLFGIDLDEEVVVADQEVVHRLEVFLAAAFKRGVQDILHQLNKRLLIKAELP